MMAAGAADKQVTGGFVRGVDGAGGDTLFYGIPFAAPPVGPLRWKAPQPVVPWQGVRDATRQAVPCLQKIQIEKTSEDCLTLDVHVPKHADGTRLPVMVWIHGGANRSGSNVGYTESSIVERGVVLVTVQYRLGIFGFLSHPALSAEANGASGNYAIMDMVAALKWVKANIAQFGGDPRNVTLIGQSAGAQDTGILMVSPLARGLFHKAIQESGSAGLGYVPRTLAQNEKLGEDLVRLAGIAEGPNALANLRSASGAALLDAAEKLAPTTIDNPTFMWDQLVIDGLVVPRDPAEILARHQQAKVPLITGITAREITPPGGVAGVRQAVTAAYGDKAPLALKLYGLAGPENPPDDPLYGNVALRVSTDLMFRCPSAFTARHQRQAGQKVWQYQFDLGSYGSNAPVEHGAELSYVFGWQPKGDEHWPPLQEYWTNFAKTGDPNGAGLPTWKELGAAKNYLEFTREGPRAGTDLAGAVAPLCTRP
jgi:para-nitrobenzyl esterase